MLEMTDTQREGKEGTPASQKKLVSSSSQEKLDGDKRERKQPAARGRMPHSFKKLSKNILLARRMTRKCIHEE